MNTLYHKKLLDLHKETRFQRALENADQRAEARNRLCGDEIRLYLKFDYSDVSGEAPPLRIALACYEASGCAVMKASAALLAEALQGATAREAAYLAENARKFLHGDDLALPGDSPFRLLEGVRAFPSRARCALLPFEALTLALEERSAGKFV
jgi:nitrogen fixation NifU-like protein